MRGMILNRCILRMLKDTFSLGEAHVMKFLPGALRGPLSVIAVFAWWRHIYSQTYYSRTAMARTALKPWKFLLNIGSSSHRGLIKAPGLAAIEDN